ncbi:MAG: TrkH family potassium uptake protein [Peptoniphilaceae bacterium]|nr:TrkH family potassium uptake protein [Peptoniphilaceae bacterium]MDD7382904.1 TrkH family potassium uptake protein [Peptoniphilaceae bacterium]MDY3737655.1 TrkH family potassium uptake protein [Peptoniphilaceae bacterium]
MKKILKKLYQKPQLLILETYILVIFIGAIILTLPISSSNGEYTPFIDAFFTSTSAFCVTGLVTVTSATYWNLFGKIIILLIIQLGGIGIMTLTAMVFIFLNKNISLKQRALMQEESNSSNRRGIVKLMKYIMYSTFIIETVGAILLSFEFIPQYGVVKGIWFSIFHSISAYCNAGFDIISENSLNSYASNLIIILSISSLIILGGIGFRVYSDVLENKCFSKLKIQSKIAIKYTVILLVIGCILFLFIEWNNPLTMKEDNLFSKLMKAFFQSVTTRTAGFFSINQANLKDASAFVTIILMFIGGSSGGTAGGIKITTFATLLGFISAQLNSRSEIVILKRRIPEDTVRKAVSITVISAIWVVFISFLLMITEKKASSLDVIFEVTSAFATVGITRGLTPVLTIFGKIAIIITMVFGKIGPLGLLFALSKKKKNVSFKEATENIMVG